MKRLLSALIAGLFLYVATGCGRPGYHLNGRFNNLQQLRPGDPVMVAGAKIGHVERIALDPPGPSIVKMAINAGVMVRVDTTAKIETTASGKRCFIVLDLGSPMAPFAVEGTILKTTEQALGAWLGSARHGDEAGDLTERVMSAELEEIK